MMKGFGGGLFADLTFGEGGHTERLLDIPGSRVIAFDRDESALNRYREAGKYREQLDRLTLVHAAFSEFPERYAETSFDGIVADLGVSTRQLLEGERGFSFAADGPLDMRMDQTRGKSLAEKLDQVSERELAEVLEKYGEIRGGRRVASNLLTRRAKGEIQTTADLSKIMGGRVRDGEYLKTHPATQLFLALRMWVNDEFGEVEKTLPRLIERLKPGGRLAVLSFHSVEDRLVKHAFKEAAGQCVCGSSPCLCRREKMVTWLHKKPLSPSEEELRTNPRSRSAKLRCVEKDPQ